MKSVFFCPNCGIGNSEFNAACNNCGHDLPFLSVGSSTTVCVKSTKPNYEKIHDRFEIIDLLGKGGMGVVYRAFDHLLDREVAVKVCPLEQALTMREARAASALNHPHIVTIFDFLVEGANCFLVMELIEGETLERALKLGRLSFPRALEMGIQIADALDHAHHSGVVHCDIKPGNIMISPDGRIKVLDFGLAAFQSDPKLIRSKPQGTLVFMSPEQIIGATLDARSDLFSFGVVFYQMITGRHPFLSHQSQNPSHQILHGEPLLTEIDHPRLAKPLQKILKRLLAKDPEKRLARAGVLSRDLVHLQDTLISTPENLTLKVNSPGVEGRASHKRTISLIMLFLSLLFLFWELSSFKTNMKPQSEPLSSDLLQDTAQKQRLAILPFRLIDEKEGDRALRDGIQNTLTAQLIGLKDGDRHYALLPASQVRDMSSETSVDALETLGAEWVLEGSLQRLKSSLEIVLHLVDTRKNAILATKTVDGQQDRLAEFQNQITLAALDMLDPDFPFEPVTNQSRAYEYYLMGKGHFASRQKAQQLNRAIFSFEKATEIDPKFPGGHASLSRALIYSYRLRNRSEVFDRAAHHAERALVLGPQLAEAWLVSGLISRERGDFKTAIAQLEEASRLNPLNTDALVELGTLHKYLKAWPLAENAYRQAIKRRASAWRPRYNLAVLFFQLGQYEDAESMLLEAINVAPSKYLNYQTLGSVYYILGKRDLALFHYQKALEIKPTATVYSNLGTLFYFDGRYARAAESFRGALEFWKENYLLWGNLGDACRFLPESGRESKNAYEEALRLLRIKRKSDPQNINWRIHEALYLARTGQFKKVNSILGEGIETQELQEIYNLAIIYELTGQREKALSLLGTGLEIGLELHEVNHEPDLVKLRQDKGFGRLISKGVKNEQRPNTH